MKVSIGFRPTLKPYGGGNNFVNSLSSMLRQDGHEVVYDLKDSDIDIILMINPLNTSEFSTYNNYDIDFYQTFKNKTAISIQRFNECDERKGTENINRELINKNLNIDFNVFVSNWLKDIFYSPLKETPFKVIRGGPDKTIFNMNGKKKWDNKLPIKLVTHHWSNHINKGYEVYQYIDQLLNNSYWKLRLSFTLIGNYPKDIQFQNTNLIPPLNNFELSKELRNHHIYITASKNEPSGNHHMEGILCGLPVLFMDSGGVTEYCEEFGVKFDKVNLEIKLNELIDNYSLYFEKIKNYPYSFEHTYGEYIKLFNYLCENKNKISNLRKDNSKAKVILHYILNKLFKISRQMLVYSKILLGSLKRKL